MAEAPRQYETFEASELFCPRCRQARQVRKHLLLVLPTGNKYDYVCQDCGTPIGGKVDNDATAFRQTSQAAAAAARRAPPAARRLRPRPPTP